MAWRLANSLVRLRDQVNSAYPNRNRASDGTIGDAAHAASASDHNPNAYGVVCALDLTHHAGYFDAHALAERLRVYRHPALKYIISNSRICSANTGWRWVAYNGSNPHSRHIHISVGQGYDGRSVGNYDDTTNWNINGASPQGVVMDSSDGRELYLTGLHRPPENDSVTGQWNGQKPGAALAQLRSTPEWQSVDVKVKNFDNLAKQVAELSTRPSKAELQAVVDNLSKAQDKIKELEATKSDDTILLDEGKSWLTRFINRLFNK